MNGHIAGKRLNLADVLLAEAHRFRAEKLVLGRKKRIGGVIALAPGNDGNHVIALHQRMGAAFLHVHHEVVVGKFCIFTGGDIFRDHPFRQITKYRLKIAYRCRTCAHMNLPDSVMTGPCQRLASMTTKSSQS
ncbi:conserved hypothetical protein [Brucella ovis ATCC 25840]|uniref:Uncharacterized protein n=1 Tax=Brucella ovis (strain ATCC 25840 / 63/290 / NCTC 10512) TaxID=444178 RepID=A0A0H3AUU1_BRUO2|nr:conserved hypothetical protein [Brucella ovis ATCC 25840]